MDLIDRQEAIKAVTYAMRNGGNWRPALEAVPAFKLPSFRGGNIPGGGKGCQGLYRTEYITIEAEEDEHGQL